MVPFYNEFILLYCQVVCALCIGCRRGLVGCRVKFICDGLVEDRMLLISPDYSWWMCSALDCVSGLGAIVCS